MKKIIKLGTILSCVFILVACGGKPANMSDDVYDIGIETLRIADQYLEAKITISEAKTKTDKLYDKLEKSYSVHEDVMVRLNINIIRASYSLEDDIEIKKSRDKLANELGK